MFYIFKRQQRFSVPLLLLAIQTTKQDHVSYYMDLHPSFPYFHCSQRPDSPSTSSPGLTAASELIFSVREQLSESNCSENNNSIVLQSRCCSRMSFPVSSLSSIAFYLLILRSHVRLDTQCSIRRFSLRLTHTIFSSKGCSTGRGLRPFLCL